MSSPRYITTCSAKTITGLSREWKRQYSDLSKSLDDSIEFITAIPMSPGSRNSKKSRISILRKSVQKSHRAASAAIEALTVLELEANGNHTDTPQRAITILYCGAVAAFLMATEEKLPSRVTPAADSQEPDSDEYSNLTVGLQEAEITYRIATDPIAGLESFSFMFKQWLLFVLRACKLEPFDAYTVTDETITLADEKFGEWYASDAAGTQVLRDFLALGEATEDQNLEIIRSLASLSSTLQDWIDSSQQRSASEAEWESYRDSLRSLPEASETMFNEDFGVSHVFQPPVISYHINRRAPIKRQESSRVEDVGGLIGGLLSNRVSGQDLIIVSGGPGSGKSTFCRVIASRLASSPEVHPVFFRLRKVKDLTDIISFIEEQLQRLGLIDRLSDLAAVSNPVLILDGYDELAMSSKARLRQFFTLLRDDLSAGPFRKAKIIVSGRDTLFPGGEGLPIGSHVLTLQPFDRDRIGAWGDAWRMMHKSGPGCTFHPELLVPTNADSQVEHHPLQHLVTWPLTLHLLAQIHTAGKLTLGEAEEEVERAYLYRAILAETASRQVEQSSGKGRLDEAKMRRFLRVLAWEMYIRIIDSMDASDVIPILREFFPQTSDSDLSELAEVAIVNAPELTRGEETGFEFVHKSFSEYLVAEHIAEVVERVCFKALDFGTTEPTWRMSEAEAAAALAPTIAIRLLPAEVQEMLEPMLGVLQPFSEGLAVDDNVETDLRLDGLTKVLRRMEILYQHAVTGRAILTLQNYTKEDAGLRSPLETQANYCAGVLMLGAAAARRLDKVTDDGADNYFNCEPDHGIFWRFVATLQAGSIVVDNGLARRLFQGSSVTAARNGGLADTDYPVYFSHFGLLKGFRQHVSGALKRMMLLVLFEDILNEDPRRVRYRNQDSRDFDYYHRERLLFGPDSLVEYLSAIGFADRFDGELDYLRHLSRKLLRSGIPLSRRRFLYERITELLRFGAANEAIDMMRFELYRELEREDELPPEHVIRQSIDRKPRGIEEP
jgi:hypothetical protein